MSVVGEVVGITSGLLAIAEFSLCASKALYQQISSIKNHNDTVEKLYTDLSTFTAVLTGLNGQFGQSDNDPHNKRLELLKRPLLECGVACDTLSKNLTSCTAQHPEEKREVIKKWLKLQYKGKSVQETTSLIGSYKSTLTVALGLINL